MYTFTINLSVTRKYWTEWCVAHVQVKVITSAGSVCEECGVPVDVKSESEGVLLLLTTLHPVLVWRFSLAGWVGPV